MSDTLRPLDRSHLGSNVTLYVATHGKVAARVASKGHTLHPERGGVAGTQSVHLDRRGLVTECPRHHRVGHVQTRRVVAVDCAKLGALKPRASHDDSR